MTPPPLRGAGEEPQEEGDDDDVAVCAVCLDPVDPGTGPEACRLPTCGHLFHVACILNCARRDPRCPVCRRIPEGVLPRPRGTGDSQAATPRQPEEGPAAHASAEEVFAGRLLVQVHVVGQGQEDLLSQASSSSPARARRLPGRSALSRPDVAQRHASFCRLQARQRLLEDHLNLLFREQCRAVWQRHPTLRALQARVRRLRRQERRARLWLEEHA